MFSNDQNIERIAQFIEEGKRWLELKASYTRFSLVDKVVRIVTVLTLVVVLFLVFVLFLTFMSFAAAMTLGGVLGSMPVGFLIVGLAYIVLFVVIYCSRHGLIERPLITFIVSILAEDLQADDYLAVDTEKDRKEAVS